MNRIIIFFLFSMIITGVACNEKTNDPVSDGEAQTYTCPMHPQIVQNEPGQCPICGMDLVAVTKNGDAATLMLGQSQRLLANIVTDTIATGSFSSTKQLNGRFVVNPEQIEMISSRVPGRIEDLYFRETGVQVKKGQALYRIYSEQLGSLQQEYLVALAQLESFPGDIKFQQIAEAARQRLLLYDQTDAQLRLIRSGRKTSPYVTYYAPVNGVVAELFTAEGQYVAEGGAIMRIEGYQTIWVEADVYPSEAGSVKTGQEVNVRVPGYEKPIEMRIEFLAPALQTGSQLMTVRGRIPNPDNNFRAGMQVIVEIPVITLAEIITVPVDAIIRDGNGTHIWLEEEPGIFAARTVKTGAENADRVTIEEGLKPGDVAVISGAYLLYSEFILKKGSTPAGEHKH